MNAELFFDAPDVQSLAGHGAATVGLAQPAARGLLRFLTCGSVDDGKSTLIGRLLYDANSLFDDQLSTLQRDSRQYGTAGDTLDFALLVDGLQAEREQGITIDVAYRFFATPKRKFIVADTPGHVQYTRNMVSGASTADLAIVLVDARKGLLEQTRRHSFLASLLGIRHIVLAVNKIDLTGYDAAIFNKIVADYTEFAKDLNFSSVQPIPLSARFGDNLREKSPHTPWYQGPSLLNYLEDIPLEKDPSDAEFRFPVQYVNRPHAEFRGFAGTIASGHIAVGDEVVIARSGVTSTISRIVTGDGESGFARGGEAVTLVLKDECDISRGDLLVSPKARPLLSDRLVAKLVWFSQEPMQIGKQYLLRSQTGLANVTIGTLNHRIDMDDFSHEAAQQLLINQIGKVTIHSAVPLAFDAYQHNQATGSFILIDRQSNATVAAGMIDAALRKASNIHLSASKITPLERAEQKYQTPAVLWMTGLSGSGKSTLAALVEQKLHQAGKHCFILDGDNLRHGLNADLGFSMEDRSENIRRVAEVARLMLDAGLIVIVATISPIKADRDLARRQVGDYPFIEVFVDTPLETCMQRDPKGLYLKAQAGDMQDFTGIHMRYQPPERPDLHLQTNGQEPHALAEQVEQFLNQQGIIQTYVSEGWSI